MLNQTEQPAEPTFAALDIETVTEFPANDDWRNHRPLGIACVAICYGSTTTTFHSRDAQGNIAERMTAEDVQYVVRHLMDMPQKGTKLVTWNGAGFDFPVMADESGMMDEVQDLARSSIDMMFHLHCVKGHPAGLDAAAEGTGTARKTHDISGKNAPALWRDGKRNEVIAYCAQDAYVTWNLAQTAQRLRAMRWMSRSGRMQTLALPKGWLAVEEAAQLPLPDTSWMTDPIPRERFNGWLTE